MIGSDFDVIGGGAIIQRSNDRNGINESHCDKREKPNGL